MISNPPEISLTEEEAEEELNQSVAPSGIKAPPPSPERTQMKKTRSKPSKRMNSKGSDVTDSFAALSRSKSRAITFSHVGSMEEEPEASMPGNPKKSEGDLYTESWKRRCCKCLLAFAGDCAALCCCPCTILHLLALICIRLPLTVVYGAYGRIRRRRGNKNRRTSGEFDQTAVVVRSSFNTWPFGEQLVIDFPPYPGGFGDQKHWSFFDGSECSVGSAADKTKTS